MNCGVDMLGLHSVFWPGDGSTQSYSGVPCSSKPLCWAVLEMGSVWKESAVIDSLSCPKGDVEHTALDEGSFW